MYFYMDKYYMVCYNCTNNERITAYICSIFHKLLKCPKSPKPWADIAYTIYSSLGDILANTPQYMVYQKSIKHTKQQQQNKCSNIRRTAKYATIITYYI